MMSLRFHFSPALSPKTEIFFTPFSNAILDTSVAFLCLFKELRAAFDYPLRFGGARVDGETNETESKSMMDLIYIGMVVGFFLGSAWYVRACERS